MDPSKPTPTKNSYTLLQTRLDEQRMQVNRRAVALAALKNELEQLWLPCSFFDAIIDFDCLPHADVIKVIKLFGGKWKKEPGAHDATVHYTTTYKGIELRCYSGSPPPNCKVVEVEELIPSHYEPERRVKRRKLVCVGDIPDPTLSAAPAANPPEQGVAPTAHADNAETK